MGFTSVSIYASRQYRDCKHTIAPLYASNKLSAVRVICSFELIAVVYVGLGVLLKFFPTSRIRVREPQPNVCFTVCNPGEIRSPMHSYDLIRIVTVRRTISFRQKKLMFKLMPRDLMW